MTKQDQYMLSIAETITKIPDFYCDAGEHLAERYVALGENCCPYCCIPGSLVPGPIAGVGQFHMCKACKREFLVLVHDGILAGVAVTQRADEDLDAIYSEYGLKAAKTIETFLREHPNVVPLQLICSHCGEPCLSTDKDGVRLLGGVNSLMHVACVVRALIGSVGHQRHDLRALAGGLRTPRA